MSFYPGADGAAVGAVTTDELRAGVRKAITLSPDGNVPTAALVLAGVIGLAATVATIAFTVQAQPGSQLAAVGRGAVVAIPVAVALYACRRGPYPRFAWLLLGAALLWSVSGLAESTEPLSYSVGRVAAWPVEALVVYLALAFPSGRLPGARERTLVYASLAIVAVMYLPTALVIKAYPVPAPWTSCVAQCPHNAFMVSESQPAFVSSIIQPGREVLTQLVFLAAIVLLLGRARDATTLIRRSQGPVLAVAIIRFAAVSTYLIVRRAGLTGTSLDVLGWIWLLTLPGLAVGFLWGMLRWRLFAADTLERLPPGPPAAARGMSEVLATALDDPTLRVLYRVDSPEAQWVSEGGEPAELPGADSALDVTEITGPHGRLLAIVHDRALSEIRPVVQAAAAQVVIALENQALVAEVKSSLRELAESRGRIVAAGDSERRRIERNLHDGAQQRLIALLVRLELAGREIDRDPSRSKHAIQDIAVQVELAIAEIRGLARGIYPSLLTDFGVAKALKATVATAPIRTTIESDGIGRYPPDAEACVYFTCMEALQNAYKHARGATSVRISLTDGDRLDFEVRDDGAGFDPSAISTGTGIANIHDRVASIGGRLTIESGPRGTTVAGSVPVRPTAAP
ncbi:MAG: sensor histidine kinase [Solirubrobacteraceae bacterium]